MNRLIWLLAMYVLILTGLPCPDSDCHAHAVSTSSVPASHDSNEQHEAPCSPFCHCATCVGFTVPQPLVSTLLPQTASRLSNPSTFAYHPSQHEDVIASIWQPPKR
ncbi:hypothetical protein DYU11_06465 [Fibrisoma montanum]|uniref:DUF2946 domain-containing protein n=1 Tax=Fibrisoma montanum TaxID=2305895 RepID=A0A418MDT0_9BACT|nr:DUF6660 family protein [Fibrisoma montanum]RIV24958.1 hypothetical protein DYU11_06465 [Fibrisoma montanum]